MNNNEQTPNSNRKSLFHDWLGEPLTFIQWVKYKIERYQDRHCYWRVMRPMYRKIRKAASDFRAWDDGYLFDILDAVLDCWIQYYTQGYNVITADENKPIPRAQIAMGLKERLEAMNEAEVFLNKENPYDDWILKTGEFFDYMKKYIHYMWD